MASRSRTPEPPTTPEGRVLACIASLWRRPATHPTYGLIAGLMRKSLSGFGEQAIIDATTQLASDSPQVTDSAWIKSLGDIRRRLIAKARQERTHVERPTASYAFVVAHDRIGVEVRAAYDAQNANGDDVCEWEIGIRAWLDYQWRAGMLRLGERQRVIVDWSGWRPWPMSADAQRAREKQAERLGRDGKALPVGTALSEQRSRSALLELAASRVSRLRTFGEATESWRSETQQRIQHERFMRGDDAAAIATAAETDESRRAQQFGVEEKRWREYEARRVESEREAARKREAERSPTDSVSESEQRDPFAGELWEHT